MTYSPTKGGQLLSVIWGSQEVESLVSLLYCLLRAYTMLSVLGVIF